MRCIYEIRYEQQWESCEPSQWLEQTVRVLADEDAQQAADRARTAALENHRLDDNGRVTLGRTFGPHRLLGGCRAFLWRALPGGAMRLLRQRGVRCCGRSFSFQGAMNRTRPLGRGWALRRCTVAARIGALGTLARPFAGFAFPRRRQIYARAPCLRQTDGDRLLGRTRSMLAFADVVHFLAHKLTGLCRGRLPLALILPRPLERFSLWHGVPPLKRKST